MKENFQTILTIILPLLGAGIGFMIKHYIEKRKEVNNELTRQRREMYQQYVNLIIDIFSNSKLNKKKDDRSMLASLYEFYKKYVLYASPNVIKSFSDYFQYVYNIADFDNDSKKGLELITKIMYEMRKDLGLNNKGLGKNGQMLMRALIKDYDQIWN